MGFSQSVTFVATDTKLRSNEMTITFSIVWVPIILTIVPIIWALFIVDGGGGQFSGLSNIIALIPALFISMLSWIIYSFFK